MKITTALGHCWIDFDNGYRLSIFNGFGSYSENHNDYDNYKETQKDNLLAKWESKDVEMAIIKNGKFVTKEVLDINNDVKGYVSIEELIEIINKVKEL